MSTLLKPLKVREVLLEKKIKFITPGLFGQVFRVKSYQNKYFLEEQTKEGLFLRLKKGLYCLQTDRPGEEEIANRLYQPSYLSFEYALAYYGILLESPYTITSATTKATRLFDVDNISYSYNSISPRAYTGYYLKKVNGTEFLIAEPEKALADYLYFAKINHREPNDRLDTSGLDQKKIHDYAKFY